MITSSHNPCNWNGVKYKASYGGSGSPAIMAAIESYLGQEPLRARTSAAHRQRSISSVPISRPSRVFADLEADRRRGTEIR